MADKPTYEELEKYFIENKDTIEKISELNEIFEQLGTNPRANIDIIVQHTSKLLQGACCLYNRLDDDKKSLIAWSTHNLPPDFKREAPPNGHICYEATIKGKDKPVIIEDIGSTVYQETDPNVNKYGLKSYLGFPVLIEGKAIGSLCIVDIKKRKFSSTEINIISTLAKAVSLEEERNRTEQALRESEKRWQSLTSNTNDIIQIMDIEGNILYANRVFPPHEMKDVIGKSAFEFMSYEHSEVTRESIKRLQRREGPQTLEIAVRVSEYDTTQFEVKYVPMLTNGKVCKIIAIAKDITERKQAKEEKKKIEKQLQQAHKMEAIGTLAGGIAHDFNNMLSIILGNTELAMDDVPEWNPARHCLGEIKTASLRSKNVVKQLLNFSRKTDPEQKPVNISPIIKDCLKFLRSSIPSNIKIYRTIPDEPGIISADPTQIHQAILNLCTNAAQAMSENGGIMEVGLSVIDIGKNEAMQDIELNKGRYVKLTVSDTGHGIAKEHLDRVFDPYFTTREVGEGSGIGLSVVHGIVKSHDGAISVDSQHEKGTTFNVFLPVVEKEPAFKIETGTTIPTGNERILFVDDEKSIVDMTSQTLERLGYTVTAKTSSKDTLETFRTRSDNFDLIISDMSMPEITGDKLAKELQKINPEIPIILCTGHSEKIDDEKAKSIGVRALVMKPIAKSVLAKTIRKVLD